MVKLLHNIVFACFFLLIAAINNINARPETTEAYQVNIWKITKEKKTIAKF